MKNLHLTWILGLAAVMAIIITPIVLLWPTVNASATLLEDNPAAYLPVRPTHTDHSNLSPGIRLDGNISQRVPFYS